MDNQNYRFVCTLTFGDIYGQIIICHYHYLKFGLGDGDGCQTSVPPNHQLD